MNKNQQMVEGLRRVAVAAHDCSVEMTEMAESLQQVSTRVRSFIDKAITAEYARREAVLWDFCVSGAFVNELHVVQERGVTWGQWFENWRVA